MVALLLVGFGAALVTTFGLVELHDEILKSSFEQGDQALQSWVHGFATPLLTEMMRGHAERAPLHRNVETAEVGNTALFLSSSLASGITGEITFVDCGFNITGI